MCRWKNLSEWHKFLVLDMKRLNCFPYAFLRWLLELHMTEILTSSIYFDLIKLHSCQVRSFGIFPKMSDEISTDHQILQNFIWGRLTFPVLCISESIIKIKVNLNFYFHTSLWSLKRFYEGLKGLHKTFWGTTKKCENKNLS